MLEVDLKLVFAKPGVGSPRGCGQFGKDFDAFVLQGHAVVETAVVTVADERLGRAAHPFGYLLDKRLGGRSIVAAPSWPLPGVTATPVISSLSRASVICAL